MYIKKYNNVGIIFSTFSLLIMNMPDLATTLRPLYISFVRPRAELASPSIPLFTHPSFYSSRLVLK